MFFADSEGGRARRAQARQVSHLTEKFSPLAPTKAGTLSRYVADTQFRALPYSEPCYEVLCAAQLHCALQAAFGPPRKHMNCITGEMALAGEELTLQDQFHLLFLPWVPTQTGAAKYCPYSINNPELCPEVALALSLKK